MSLKLLRFIVIILALLTCAGNSFAQQLLNISGKIADINDVALPGVSIYISGSKVATVTNDDGQFTLKLSAGKYDLVIKSIGYKTLVKKVILQNEDLTVNAKLQEESIKLASVTIKANPYRDKDLELFKQLFIGSTSNSQFCKITNPNVLDFVRNQKEETFNAVASDFLIIENEALGYKVKYLLESFDYSEKQGKVSYKGFAYFEDLKGSQKEYARWNQNRIDTYNGSPTHFFNALYNNDLESQGFLLLKIENQRNPKRPSDSVLKANITRHILKQQKETGLISMDKNDSLSYWLELKKKPIYLPTLIARPVLRDTLLHTIEDNFKAITGKEIMYVVYTERSEDPKYISSLKPEVREMFKFKNVQLSQIKLIVDKCDFSSTGILANPQSIYYSGYWGWKNVADSLPIDYVLPK